MNKKIIRDGQVEPREITEESMAALPEHCRIPVAFTVDTVFHVELLDRGLGGVRLVERQVERPWVKDYDALESPTCWSWHWDISNWGMVSAFVDGVRVGGCAIAYDTPGLHKLEDRKDVAAIWDLRVAPKWRRKGIGGRLIEASVAWSNRRGCRVLKAETQSINVPACRCYARHGFVLDAVNRHAYAELPDEVELVWRRTWGATI